jgi:hypothetical protein
MAPTVAVEEKTTIVGNRSFLRNILGMPLIATVVIEDSLRNDGSGYCHTFDGVRLLYS